jgi:hypothetical protein
MRGRWMPWSVRAACLILALAAAPGPGAQQGGAASGSFRAAQDVGLDLSLRPVDLLNLTPGSAPSGSFRAAQDIGTRGAWPGLYGERWSAEGYQGPGSPPPWAGGRDQPLDSRPRF